MLQKNKHKIRAAAPIFSSSTMSVVATTVCMYVGMINFDCQNTHSARKVRTFLCRCAGWTGPLKFKGPFGAGLGG